MANGYMGKLLNVDLTRGTFAEEALDPALGRDYIGGYGLGARLLYDRIPAGADPLGPQNILGFLTGPLTGTPADHRIALHGRGQVAQDRRRLGRRQLRRPLRPAPQVRRLRRPALRRHLPEAGLPVRRRGHSRAARRGRPLGHGRLGAGGPPGGAPRQGHPGLLDRAGRRAAGAHGLHHERQGARGRPLGPGRGHGRQAPQVQSSSRASSSAGARRGTDEGAAARPTSSRPPAPYEVFNRYGTAGITHDARPERRRAGEELGRGGARSTSPPSGRGASATTPWSGCRATSLTGAGAARSPAAAR